jgi:glucose-1-phosphatase
MVRAPPTLKVVYKAVIFDLGRVLIYFDFQRGYRALEGLCAYSAAEMPRRIGSSDLVERFETGLVEPADFVQQFSRILGLNLEHDRFCEIWSSIFGETLVSDSMLEGLAKRYRLVLLSNTNAIHFEMLKERYPLLRHFHELVLSYEVKAMKPDPKIFREAIAKANCRPEECFYTDDIAAYVEAAKKEGIDAVVFEGAAKLEGELRKRGIEWEGARS